MLETPAGTFVDHDRARAALHEAEMAFRKSEVARTWTEARVALEICRRGFLVGEEAPWIIGQRRLLLEGTPRAFERSRRPTSSAADQRTRQHPRVNNSSSSIRFVGSGYRLLYACPRCER